jgi:hypothetical protein
MISSEEAFLMLNKWREDKHPLKLMIAGEGFRISFGGIIEDINGSRLLFLPEEPNACEGDASLDLTDCEFEYGDKREAPRGSISGLKLSAILTVLPPDRTALFMFAELRL